MSNGIFLQQGHRFADFPAVSHKPYRSVEIGNLEIFLVPLAGSIAFFAIRPIGF